MNTRAQFEAHPDAESLNAFAEQALGTREREEILVHLAACGRCREIVFLTREATELEMEAAREREEELVPAAAMPAAVAPAATRAASVGPPAAWYRSWWMVWIPVGALAVIVGLATVMHVRHVEQNSEMAKNLQVAPPMGQSQLQAPAEPAKNLESTEPGQKLNSANRPEKAAAKDETKELGLPKSAPGAAPPPPTPAPPSSFGTDGTSEAREEGLMARSAEGSGELKRQESEAVESKKEQARAAAEAQVQLQAAPAVPQSANETVAVQQADQIAAAPANPKPGGSLKATHGALAVGTFAAYKAQPTKLPSGLEAVSTVSGEHAVLVVDQAGNVFLSGDSGVHWEGVARQWKGRAVAVRRQELSQKEAGGGKEESSAKFELVNDEGRVWESSDGKTWTMK